MTHHQLLTSGKHANRSRSESDISTSPIQMSNLSRLLKVQHSMVFYSLPLLTASLASGYKRVRL